MYTLLINLPLFILKGERNHTSVIWILVVQHEIVRKWSSFSKLEMIQIFNVISLIWHWHWTVEGVKQKWNKKDDLNLLNARWVKKTELFHTYNRNMKSTLDSMHYLNRTIA